ncbi:unnamed protein product [Spirodela intermedia]|uniref:Protein kinase domain-containing protein n=1 Tax=Spirodela intermedia TaxID=51605 RepID=A0A7I8IE92_SPIIN|nr:unnamed protein product [Spirodela intermedia]CAA6656108.1 unnamed protein product [Spirodela intermedia]
MMEGRGDIRVVGDYMLGPKIGAGSFAVVWQARHRLLGLEVAVKEIDKKQLSRKLRESLFKEIDILRNVSHPNIVRLHEAIETQEKIYLVLEYCTGGDLAAFITRHGRVSEAVARHLMQQLASGLQVLRENNLIHRDLKPQNLLLSSNDESSVLKIGDFGFARYLMPQGLADTLCGSPLYMAPEIIQNQKYDAKADLWSVGAILFQLVTGKPPFDGDTQFQLFQNILRSNELQFHFNILCEMKCAYNAVERLTFEEFFNHKFMATERLESNPCRHHFRTANGLQHNSGNEESRKPVVGDPLSLGWDNSTLFRRKAQLTLSALMSAGDSLESIEREYVIINTNFSSMDTISTLLEASLLDNSTTRCSIYKFNKIGMGTCAQLQNRGLALGSLCVLESALGHFYNPDNSPSSELNAKRLLLSSSSRRLQLLCKYAHGLSEVSREKLNEGQHAESFSVELVVLALWKDALRLCSDWLSSAIEDSFRCCSINDQQSSQNEKTMSLGECVGFRTPRSVYAWAEQGFLAAFDRAEMISNELRHMDGNSEMPDALEIIFQSALSAGKNGAVDEFMGNGDSAVVAYSRATILLSFILTEAQTLQLNPPFSLSASDQQRIFTYISTLESHLNRSEGSIYQPRKLITRSHL